MALEFYLVLDQPAAPGMVSLADAAEHLLQLAGLVALAYVIVMGLSYRAGTQQGQVVARKRRAMAGQPNLMLLADGADATPFWKDPTLIQGGLSGLAGMMVLLGYVVIMLALSRPPVAVLPITIAVLMAFPNMMAGIFVAQMALMLAAKRHSVPIFWLVAVLSVAAAVATWMVIKRMRGGIEALGVQFILFTVQSLFMSHLTGVFRGIASANFEKRLPLVEVITTNGEKNRELRMLKAADTEYRFIAPDGTECLIPKDQIQMVRTIAPSAEPKKS